MGDRWLEWLVLALVGVGFSALILWVNFYALDDASPDPGDEGVPSGPDADRDE
jgi:hypothetical protein